MNLRDLVAVRPNQNLDVIANVKWRPIELGSGEVKRPDHNPGKWERQKESKHWRNYDGEEEQEDKMPISKKRQRRVAGIASGNSAKQRNAHKPNLHRPIRCEKILRTRWRHDGAG